MQINYLKEEKGLLENKNTIRENASIITGSQTKIATIGKKYEKKSIELRNSMNVVCEDV